MEEYLKRLNDKQLEAVQTIDGALLVLAGAGSGKTTVLASRVAYILQNTYARPWNILAITFTNKAANEMKERIARIVGDEAKDMWIGTFHSICVRILRTCIDRLGYGNDFVIYDTADSRTLIKECMKEKNIDEKVFPVRSVQSIISKAKNDLIDPDSFESACKNNPRLRAIADVYRLYQSRLISNNALDFDDIILLTVNILKDNEDVAEKYQARFQYILVDEYQDTNNTQYELIRILAAGYGNICVVGDDDQSIYKFRGANINNILEFEKDYKNAKRIMLEQNYRSTATILNAANAVIANNKKRMGKKLWTDSGDGDPVITYTGFTEKDEAQFVADQVERRYKETGHYSDCAVLYRTNAQSRAIEDAFMKNAIPYKVLAGLRFYDRKEVKDFIAYLRVVYNHSDDLSLRRIINEPKRKIGAATLEKVQIHADEEGVSNFEIISEVNKYPDLKSAASRLTDFVKLIKDLREKAKTLSIDELASAVIKDSGYMAALESENTVEAQTRIENINEFLSVVKDYAVNPEYDGTLGGFLESVTLVSDIDDYDQEQDSVVLMTIHSAKGLEFPVVFVTGLEEGIFPGMRSIGSDEDIEEERRLCYVAMTRAREKLYVTKTMSRMRFGRRELSVESRFFQEIPSECVNDLSSVSVKADRKLHSAGIEILPGKKNRNVYQKPKTEPAMDMSGFKAGDRVMHRKFGKGTVISAQAFGKDAILVVDFETVGTKRLMAAFSKMEKLN